MEQDIALTFDPKEFKAGFDAILKSMGNIEKGIESMTSSTNKMEKKGARSIGAWTAVMTKGLDFVIGAARKMMSFMPEIGYSMKIAGDIIGRNLLWPLRKELIPILQKMLNWVRDHRAMFVKWGMVIANVFRAVVGIVKSAFEFWSKMFTRLSAGLGKIFGGTIKSVSDLINIIIFRIALLVTTVQVLMEPVMGTLVDTMIQLWKYGKAFVDGFLRGIGNISTPIRTLVEDIGYLISAFQELLGGMGDLDPAFSMLGEIIGTTVGVVFRSLAATLRTIAGLVRVILSAINESRAIDDAMKIKDPIERLVRIREIEKRGSEERSAIGRDVWNSIKNVYTGGGGSTTTSSADSHDTYNVNVRNGKEASDFVTEVKKQKTLRKGGRMEIAK
jgi:hypothetical protein